MRLFLLVVLNVMLLPLYLGLYLFAFLITWLPIFPSRVGLENLRFRLGSGFVKAHFQLAAVFLNYAFYAIETLVIWPLGLTSVKNEKALRAFIISFFTKYEVTERVGIGFISGHFGNIEGIGQALTNILVGEFGKRFFTLAQPSRSRIVTNLVEWYRNKRGLPTLLTDRRDLFVSIGKLAAEGHSIGILVDQKPRSGGLFIDFFGVPAAFPYRGVDVCVRNQMPIMHLTARRVFPGYMDPVYAEGINSHLNAYLTKAKLEGNSQVILALVHRGASLRKISEHTQNILAGFTGWLEDLVKQNPLQWFWDYKKWSRKVSL